MFGSGSRADRKLLESLTCSLESSSPYENARLVEAAFKLKAVVASGRIILTIGDKVRIVKSVARAKVVAYRNGHDEGHRTFRELDLIGKDLVQML